MLIENSPRTSQEAAAIGSSVQFSSVQFIRSKSSYFCLKFILILSSKVHLLRRISYQNYAYIYSHHSYCT